MHLHTYIICWLFKKYPKIMLFDISSSNQLEYLQVNLVHLNLAPVLSNLLTLIVSYWISAL